MGQAPYEGESHLVYLTKEVGCFASTVLSDWVSVFEVGFHSVTERSF
jgi:hypothetical protein